MNPNPEMPMDYQELLKLAQSPAGQQFLAALKQKQGQNLNAAMAKAALGDYSQAKQVINDFLTTPEAKALLDQLRR